MYHPNQVSEMLSIPASSLRRLATEFRDMLSPQRSRHRRYTESDIALLRKVRELTGQGMSLSEIRQALTIVSETPEREATAESTLALVPGISAELDRLDSGYHQVLSELEKLREAHASDRERLQALEEWLTLPWWKRVFSTPPKR